MSVENRPYIGTWRLNNKKVVKHTPDALVYVNGDLAVPGCATCGSKIDLQKYITQVSVDPSTEGPATASISMHIPRHVGDSLYRDGNFVLRPGLEIHIYMRGYFPVKGLFADQVDATKTGGVNIANAVTYPYYLVHHGVITDVSHEYNGGEHTATLSVTDLLHFWQYQRMSTNGSAFGARPTNSKVNMSMVGHNMTGMSPYAIMYTLFRDVQGSAGGVEFALGSSTNAAANSTVVGDSLFSLSILYWQKRFSQNTMSLRMFGVDGQLYNAAQASFLASLDTRDIALIAESSKAGAKNAQTKELEPILRVNALLGNPFATNVAAASEDDIKKGALGVNPAQIQAFASDISQWGNVNLWESQYATKMEIANNVKEAVGYEFYMDVDGDIVFKPPFYNLDTSNNRVYRIEDIDIISLSVSEKEPECTVVKATGGHFKGMTGFGLENNEWGTRAEFVDYRMVAQFGWRQQTFETTYHTDPQAMFFACIARYDLFNIGVKSATCTIPIRPELRPGYPVYIEPLDCFYYIHSFSHSFSFGGQCTTTLNLVGKRAKFYAPGVRPQDGTPATVSNITLENTYNPALPLEVTALDGVAIEPKLQGFPNVVMTIDPTSINPLAFTTGIALDELTTPESMQQLIDLARLARQPVLQLDEDNGPADPRTGPFKVPDSAGTFTKIPDVTTLLAQAKQAATVYANKKSTVDQIKAVNESTKPLQILIDASKQTQDKMFPESSSRYLELLGDLKASYNPGGAIPGAYRYYSSAHPDPAMQGPGLLALDPETGQTTVSSEILVDPSQDQTAMGFKHGDTTNQLSEIKAVAGIPIAKPGKVGAYISTPTHQITTFQIAVFSLDRDGTVALVEGAPSPSYSKNALAAVLQRYFFLHLLQDNVGPTTLLADFKPLFDHVAANIQTNLKVTPVFPSAGGATTLDDLPGDEPANALQYFTTLMAEECASTASKAILANASLQAGNVTEGANFQTVTSIPGEFLPLDANLPEVWARVWQQEYSQPPGGKNPKAEPVRDQKPFYVPVFPVSDHRGYEVIGTYRYGRGMETETLGQLTNYVADKNPDYDKIDAFVAELRKTTDYAKVVGSLDPATRAQLALDITASAPESEQVITTTNPGGTQTEQGGTNQMADASKQMPLKVSVTNVAYSLADMVVSDTSSGGSNPCSCKGAEADVLMLAFDENFVSTEQAVNFENIQEFLESQVNITAPAWAAVQAAYRGAANITLSGTGGTIINPTTAGQGSLLDAFSTAGEATAAAARTASTNLATSGDALAAAQAALDEDIANFGGTGFGATVNGEPVGGGN